MIRVAYAVVHDGGPQVLLAEDIDVLQRLIAIRVVACTEPKRLRGGNVHMIREALLDERWGDAVAEWIESTGIAVDVYEDIEVWNEEFLAPDVTSFEIRAAPLFQV